MNKEFPDPFFIIGSSRSGTTYLQRVLNQHPKLFITHETRVFTYINRALNELPADDRAVLTRKEDWLRLLRREFPMLAYRFYRLIGAPKDARWGDKNPHYADPKIDPTALTTIDELFPRSQFIHILRDGRAVVASVLGKGWALNVDYAMDVWRRHVLHARAFGAQIGPERYLEVKHEDLVGDGEAVVAKIYAFLGVGPDDTVSAFLREQERERTPISKPTSDLAQQAGRPWEGRLDPDALAVVEHGLADLLVELGYETAEWRASLPAPPEARPALPTSVPTEDLSVPGSIDPDTATPDELRARLKLLDDVVADRNVQVKQLAAQLEAERTALEAARKRIQQQKERVAKLQRARADVEGDPIVRAVLRARRALGRKRGKRDA